MSSPSVIPARDADHPAGARRPAAFLWAVVGAVLVLDAVVVAFTFAVNSGVVATSGIGVLYLLYGLYRARSRAAGPARWVKVAVLGVSALLLLVFAAMAVVGRTDTVTHREDAVVVLGTAVKGEDVTAALRSRLEVAVEYSTANPDAVIVVAGGQGPGESVTEALAMERYLVARGVPGDRILREDRSTSTHENFVLAKGLLDAHFDADYTTAFVTNDYHVFRASRIAEGVGMAGTHAHADTPWHEVPVDYVRESLAIAKLALTGR